jgi:hypothetical protein
MNLEKKDIYKFFSEIFQRMMNVPKPALASALAGTSLLAYTWWTKPEPYPPYGWSRAARELPEHVSQGLGPFHYYYPEKGAVTPIDRIPGKYKNVISSLEQLRCMRPGLDYPELVNEYSSGLAMQSESSYETMKERIDLFEKNLVKRGNIPSISSKADVPVSVSVKRNLKGHAFNSSISFKERREIESKILNAISKIPGSYHPLPGSKSTSHPPASPVLLDVLRLRGLVFEAPWEPFDLVIGTGRHWPDARGVYIVSHEGREDGIDIAIWVNGEDHLEVVGVGEDGDMKKIYEAVEKVVSKISIEVARNDVRGFLTTKPEDSGIAVRCSATANLRTLSLHKSFASLCRALRLRPVVLDKHGGMFNLLNVERFELAPSEAVSRTQSAVSILVEIDSLLHSNRTALDGEKRIAQILHS